MERGVEDAGEAIGTSVKPGGETHSSGWDPSTPGGWGLTGGGTCSCPEEVECR